MAGWMCRTPAAEDAGGRERQAEEAAGRGDARQRHAEGRRCKKMVTPAARREAVAHLQDAFEVSERRACASARSGPTSVRYRSSRPDDAAVRARLRELAAERRRFGYRRLHVLLRREGIGHEPQEAPTALSRGTAAGAPPGRRKRALGTRAPMAIPQGPNQRWCLDFLSDAFTDGRRFRILPWSTTSRANAWPGRRHLAVGPAGRARARRDHRRARPAGDVRLRQRHRADQHGDPALVRRRTASNGTTSRPASRQQNAFIESFNGRLRDELLNETLFTSLAHAREAWRLEARLQHRPTAQRARQSDADRLRQAQRSWMQRDGALRYPRAPRPVPLHHRATWAQMSARTLLIAG